MTIIQVTIENRDNVMRAHDGKLPRSRLQWRGDGIEIYTKGSFPGTAYETAANLALNICIDRHIPTMTLRRQK